METLKLITLIFISYVLGGCNNTAPKAEYFVGTWKSKDGAVIELNRDFSFTAKQVNLSNIFFNMDGKNNRANFTGKWKFTTDDQKRKVIEVDSNKYHFIFDISGQGVFENKPPWDLYIFIGDPDDMNKYKFKKQQ
jgi:hypothetical protein